MFGRTAGAVADALVVAVERVQRLALRVGEELAALAIIPDPQSKLPLVIAKFHFDLGRAGVFERIAQRLACDPVDLVALDRMQGARRALHHDVQNNGSIAGLFGR